MLFVCSEGGREEGREGGRKGGREGRREGEREGMSRRTDLRKINHSFEDLV